MTRQIYGALVRLHPAAFRERFGGEMKSIFERSGHGFRCIADAALSLGRQWVLRADFRKEPEPAAAIHAQGQMFVLLDQKPGLQARHWMGAFALASLNFLVAASLLSHGGNSNGLVIGSHGSSNSGTRILGISSDRHLDTEIEVRPAEILDTFAGRAMVQRFYRTIRVLGALDANHDLVLSPDEIANAPAVLRSLDRNHDGSLEEAECVRPSPWFSDADPMRSSPALAALDVNHDGILSANEIRNAASSLKLLDKDHDGYLRPEELLSREQLQQITEGLK